MRFSVLIPTFKRPDVLRQTLENLVDCDPKPDEIVLIDADPAKSAQPLVEEFARIDGSPPIRYLSSEPGLAVQRNRGMKMAGGDVFVFLDDDVTVDRRLFAELATAYEEPTVVGATGRVIEPEPHRYGGANSWIRKVLPGGGDQGEFTRFGYPRYLRDLQAPRDVQHMLGCFMTARREAAEQVRFDEHLASYALAEDEDFSYRLSRLGRIRYIPEAVVTHEKLGYSSFDSRRFGRLVVVNRAYLFRKNFPQTRLARAQFALLVLMLLVHRVINREWRAAQGVLEGAARVWRPGR